MEKINNSIYHTDLIYTNKCNIRCRHCINDSCKEKIGKLGCNKVISILNEMPKFNVKYLGITGGESLIYEKEILEIISEAKKLGIESSLVSNGLWAYNKKNTKKVLSKLTKAGLNRLNVSCDEFHLEHVPIQNILNVSSEARKIKDLDFFLRFTQTKNYSVIDFISENKKFFKNDSSKDPLGFFVQLLLPLGRSSVNVPEQDYFFFKKSIKTRSCSFRSSPSIDFKGTFSICCLGSDAENTAFQLGNIYSDDINGLFEAYKNSIFVFYLKAKGPYFIAKLAEKNNLKKIKKTKKSFEKNIGICDYCILTLSQYKKEDILEILEAHLKKNRKEMFKCSKENVKNAAKNWKELQTKHYWK